MSRKVVVLFLVALCCALMMHQTSAAIGPQCLLPLEHGPCKAIMHMYGYNPNTNQCEQFQYGGCPGNDNAFETLESCQKACS